MCSKEEEEEKVAQRDSLNLYILKRSDKPPPPTLLQIALSAAAFYATFITITIYF